MPALIRNGYSRMTLEDVIARTRTAALERAARLSAVRSRRGAEAYRDEVRHRIKKCFGSFPRRHPAMARVAGVLEERNFRIEKLTFDGRSGSLISANLYVPSRINAPAPGILVNCQHAESGKADAESQNAAQELAQNGFVVLVFDPVGQGEREEYSMLPRSHPLRRSCAEAHNMMGKQLQLAGHFLGAWMVEDAMRALDVLAARDEVDAERLGVTGNSGGGALTTWLWALDARLSAAAPSCFVTTLLANIENELPSDAEQLPPGLIAEGLDTADFLIARTPDPALIISQKYDFFDRRGAAAAVADIARFYDMFRAHRSFASFLGEHTHGFFEDGRRAMRQFFCKCFGLRFRRDVSVRIFKRNALSASVRGSLLAMGSPSMAAQTCAFLPMLRIQRARVSGVPLPERVRRVLRLSRRGQASAPYRNLRGYWLDRSVLAGRYAVRTAPGMDSLLFKIMPPEQGMVQALSVEKEVHLYVPHWSCEAEFPSAPLRGIRRDLPLFGVDVRGIGESLCFSADASRSRWQSHAWMDYLVQGYETMLGQCPLGGRVHDLVKVSDLLVQEGADRIRITACGQGALIAALAALFHPSIQALGLYGAPESFEEWATAPLLAWPYANCPRGVLRHFDLPEVYHSLRGRLDALSYWDAKTCPYPHERLPIGRLFGAPR